MSSLVNARLLCYMPRYWDPRAIAHDIWWRCGPSAWSIVPCTNPVGPSEDKSRRGGGDSYNSTFFSFRNERLSSHSSSSGPGSAGAGWDSTNKRMSPQAHGLVVERAVV